MNHNVFGLFIWNFLEYLSRGIWERVFTEYLFMISGSTKIVGFLEVTNFSV